MLKKKGRNAGAKDATATIGLEGKLWAAADALRNNMDAAEYKHVVLGLIFIKYITDAERVRACSADVVRGHWDPIGSANEPTA